MADELNDKKITQNEADTMMRPLELDLTAVFSIMQSDIIDIVSSAGAGTSPDDLIRTITDTLSGNIDTETARTIAKSKDHGEAILEAIKPLLRREVVYGDIPIKIEQEPGSIRSGYDRDGNHWETLFENAYGYFEDTMGVDGDEVDVYLGDYPETDMVYIVHQRDPVTQEYDEDKVMMFFQSAEEAKKTYQKHYDRPGMFGGLTEVDIDQLRRMLRDRKGSKLSSFGIGNGDDRQQLIESIRKLREYLNKKVRR